MKISIDKASKKAPHNNMSAYNDSGFPILSLYVGWGKKPPTSRQLISHARSLFNSQLKPYEQRVFETDLQKIVNHLRDSFDQRGNQGVAYFAARNHLWEILPLEFSPPGICIISHSPYLRPIERQYQLPGRYAVVLFDREKAEFMLIESGKIKRFDFFKDGKVPQRFRAKKEWLGRDSKVSRQIKGKLHHHLMMIAEKFKQFVHNTHYDKLILGGHQEIFNEFTAILGEKISKKLAATVPIDFKKDLNQILAKCLGAVS